ncbi:hypothetical protein LOTGIDRAFT_160329 [Lottia gigantea]|uniref:G-protein coupled receptors family 1 profile domain-containing protein n=1 Tax=Lottia gigantea TaxID=225164 RepID=V4AFV2_LOTGI|nr:hypothetical protein LOTGIDRAFT_160329 [Lottia gigantea]ESO95782.1 hypothetical protein LOTGIDRAFT_160329 [Lottia gigantea]
MNVSNNSSGIDEQETTLISQEVFFEFNTALAQSWIPLAVIGIILNAVNIIVFADARIRNATSVYLAAISAWQIVLLVSGMISKIHQFIYGTIGQRSTKFFYFAAIYINNFVVAAVQRIIFYLVFLVALERMLAIQNPMKKHYFRWLKAPGKCILLVFCITFTFHIYSPLKYTVSDTVGDDGRTKYVLERTNHDLDVLINFGFAAKIIFVYCPLLGIMCCNIILTISLNRKRKIRQQLQEVFVGREARDRQTNVAILVSTFVFFLFNLPSTTNAFIGDVLPNYSYFSSNRYTLMFFQGVGSLSALVSCSSDFFTYIIISQTYRNIFMSKFLPCLKPRIEVPTHRYVSGNQNSSFTQSSSMSSLPERVSSN